MKATTEVKLKKLAGEELFGVANGKNKKEKHKGGEK